MSIDLFYSYVAKTFMVGLAQLASVNVAAVELAQLASDNVARVQRHAATT